MQKKFLAAVCCSFLLSPAAHGQDEGSDPSSTVLRQVQSFVVQRDGSYVASLEDLTQLNEDRAVRSQAQRSFEFNRTMEDVDVVEAYTEKPDGRRIKVQPDQVKLQQEGLSAGAPMFQDTQVKIIVFPEVAVGDKLYSRVRITRRSAVFPGQFSDATYPPFHPTAEMTLTYDLPAGMPLESDAVGFTALAPASSNGRTVYRWNYVPAPNPRLEADAVDYWDFGRHLVVSTFGSYAEVGRAYDKAAAGAAVVDAGIRAQVDSLVRGVADPREKALAIANWVRRNIRYVATYIGNGGMVPHSADAVLANLYGDCKDHAVLVEAMLKAAGIDSTPALVNWGSSYKLSPVASLGQLNHVITYVPSLDLYLDSTAADVEAGYLPTPELGKPVILARSGQVGRTPVSQSGRISNKFHVQVADDGSATFSFTRDSQGFLEEVVRWEQRNWNKPDQVLFVENLLKGRGMKGHGVVELGDFDSHGHGYAFTLRGSAENWAYLPGTVGISTDSSLYAGLSGQVFALTSETRRTQPFVCPVDDVDEEALFDFAPGAQVLALPDDVRIASRHFSYQADYRRQGQGVLVRRRFKSGDLGTRVCTPEDFAAMQSDIKRMVRDLRSQFILKGP